jgi:hypothetical protein
MRSAARKGKGTVRERRRGGIIKTFRCKLIEAPGTRYVYEEPGGIAIILQLRTGIRMRDFAYLAAGKIHLKRHNQPPQIIESKFGQSVRQRALELERRNSWKTQGRGAQFMRGGVLWGMQQKDGANVPVQVCAVARGCEPGELLYSLETSEVYGLFTLFENGKQEKRLLHTSDFRVREVCGNEQHDKIACVFTHANGNSTIAMMGRDGSNVTEVTEGDIIDLAPRWVPDKPEIVYQSAGIGRNAQGVAVGRGPFTIQKINVEQGDVTTLAEEERADLLGPQMTRDGSLYFIRRPYAPPNEGINPWRGARDLLLFPLRLFYAIFQYLNFFTATYTGKFLSDGAGARQKEADLKQMMIWGNMIDAGKAAREQRGEETPSLVPSSWQLVRKSPDGEEEVIAKNVLSFDLYQDGAVLYTNGSGIFMRTNDGKAERVGKDSLIQQVSAL